MELRRWQQEIIDSFPDIQKAHRRFIIKAPTGAGKTVLASEIIRQFYAGEKVIVLCHRLVLLEQLERALAREHKVCKLNLNHSEKAFADYDVLLSTSTRARDILDDAVAQAKLIIIDEAHRVSPNGTGYKRILECFMEKGRDDAHLLGLTASPERRTADQRDQLSLAFDAIIDGADMEKLFEEGILVRPRYRPHFIHDLELASIDISSGDFPVTKLAPAIIKSSMISHACSIYLEEREKVTPKPISAWFCPDVTVAETTVEAIEELGLSVNLITASTPIKERMQMLSAHARGEVEAVVSVGVLAEGWDNPHCNLIVHMRPTLSKVLWGQSVGRGLRAAEGKDTCVVIDVSSNWSTFGPVENLQWSLWSHRGIYLRYKNRFQWIAQQPVDEQQSYFLCDNKLESGLRCSHIYLKDKFSDTGCPVCGSYSAIDIHKEQRMEDSVNDIGLHRLFFERIPAIYEEMNKDIWRTLGRTAWTGAERDELIFLAFCKAFSLVSGVPSSSDSEFWHYALQGEAAIRHFLVENRIQITKGEEFEHAVLVDGLMHGRRIRALQANHGILLCGELFAECSEEELERKYQRALQIIERLSVMGCSSQDNLPYFKAKDVV
ncbi:MAG: DEAD/DEAH box helicase [Alphaproteobacteria bacterium]|nr:DEAD/DEAH box helicase [Alphaproteobacteria bacterium]MBL6776580.1 DEAD/DEAH box helicase [Alphaproteobacteria bacterium]